MVGEPPIEAPVVDTVNSKQGNERQYDTETLMCGFGPYKPSWLQVCNRMGVFAGFFSLSAVVTSLLSIYIVSQVTTIEKQFGLNSSKTGFLLSCNDIGFLLATLFASYAARRVHIPRVLWASTLLYGVGALVCAAAYFISKDIFESKAEELGTGALNNHSKISTFGMAQAPPLCRSVSNSSNSSSCAVDDGTFVVGLPNKYTTVAMAFLAVGMVMQGVSKAPRYPFVVTYVDDNGKKTNTAMYMGFISAAGSFGPALAFAFGGFFSKLYVTLEAVPISPRHPSFIGAWWLGFVVFGMLAIVVSFPVFCFPRRMKARDVPERKHRLPHELDSNIPVLKVVSGYLKTVMRLATNRVYVLNVVCAFILVFIAAGTVAFSAKYLETQFFLPAWQANVIMGGIGIIPACLGFVAGGLLITKRSLPPLQCIQLQLCLLVISTLLISCGYLLGCDTPDIVGIDSDKDRNTTDTSVSCGVDCHCDSSKYFPVCGSDDRNYFSPCMAGCKTASKQVFTDCGCIGQNATVVPGLCRTKCKTLVPYLVVFVLAYFAAAMLLVPSMIISIRSVSDKDKAMALGMSSFLNTLLGWFPGPVVFGWIIDMTCMLWTTSCKSKGACALYHNGMLRVARISFEVLPRVAVVFLMIWMYVDARHKTDWSSENVERDAKYVELDAIENQAQDNSLKPLVSRRQSRDMRDKASVV